MFFRKKNEPEIKKYLKRSALRISDTASNPISIFIIKFLVFILRRPIFGNKKKEKRELDNNVSVFELICFSLARTMLYLINKHPERELLSVDEILEKKYLKKNVRDVDLIYHSIKVIEHLHKKHLDWDVSKLIDDRLKFYLLNFNNPMLYNSILQSTIYNSVNLIKPIHEIETVSFHIQDVEHSFIFTQNIVIFEQTFLNEVFELIEELFIDNDNIGYRINKKWLS